MYKQAIIMIVITIVVAIGSVIVIDKALEASRTEATNQVENVNTH